MKDRYHHGDLRRALIDEGIRIINENGEEALSLRRVAAACGVSHAAPYAHFADKGSLLEAIKEHVTKRFTERLEEAVRGCGSAEDAILAMGRCYILFFRENPDYFHFLFHKQQITIHTAMDEEYTEDYYPYLMLKDSFRRYLQENHIEMSEREQELEVLKTWAIVQGFSSIATMKNVEISIPWEEIVRVALR